MKPVSVEIRENLEIALENGYLSEIMEWEPLRILDEMIDQGALSASIDNDNQLKNKMISMIVNWKLEKKKTLAIYN